MAAAYAANNLNLGGLGMMLGGGIGGMALPALQLFASAFPQSADTDWPPLPLPPLPLPLAPPPTSCEGSFMCNASSSSPFDRPNGQHQQPLHHPLSYVKPHDRPIGGDIFGAGVGLMLAATVLANLRHHILSVFHILTRPTAEVVLSNDDDAFGYVAQYVAQNSDKVFAHRTLTEIIVENGLASLALLLDLLTGRLFLRWLLRGHFSGSSIQTPSTRRHKARSLVVKTTYSDEEEDESSKNHGRPNIVLVPNDGSYVILHQKILLYLHVSTEKEKKVQRTSRRNVLALSSTRTNFTFQVYGKDESVIQNFVQTAIDAFYERQGALTHVFSLTDRWSCEWGRICSRPPRPLDSIVLAPGLMDDMLNDIQTFLTSETWYQQRGIPYRRGYLLYGPPGTGKTSCIFALAGHFKQSLCIVSLSSPELSDGDLSRLLTSAPKNSFLVLEDVDVGIGRRKEVLKSEETNADSSDDENDAVKNMGPNPSITLSGLLNALDGLAAQEGRIVFLTTNSLSSLPPALRRPGRCDRRLHFGLAERETAAQLFERIFTVELGAARAAEIGADVADKIEAAIEQGRIARPGAADLQGFYLRLRGAPERAAASVEGFVAEVEEFARLEEEDRQRRLRKDKKKKKKKSKKEEEEEPDAGASE
ncbi:hypothetical protein DFJ73DRAFT_854131 [Zopfochytrium polystomum]|nr:hypothetical protein DFJ73DRAFT_854131 [Zopfochytrium polystomum]